jgi:SnoaL-like domain
MHMTDVTTLIDGYIAMCETDPERRRTLVAEVVTDDATYVDPLMEGEGQDAIDELIAGAQAQYPGHRFVLAGASEAHHDRVRFTWHLVPDGGHAVAVGRDVGVIAGDGRLRDVVGFLEQQEG